MKFPWNWNKPSISKNASWSISPSPSPSISESHCEVYTISMLIDELQKFLQTHGDIPVTVNGYNKEGSLKPITNVSIISFASLKELYIE